MTHAVAFLITPAHPHNDNHERLPSLFARAGWRVDIWPHDALSWQDGELYCGSEPAASYTLIWPVGLGPHPTFLDRQELLSHLTPVHCINAPAAYVSSHGKSAWLQHAPDTVIAQDPQVLIDALTTKPGDWVLKPLAGSFGREVHKVTGPAQVAQLMSAQPGQYWMLQAFIDDITAGETRTLICADHIIGSYLRTPNGGWHANLAVQATPHATRLSDADARLVSQVRARLLETGIRFAAVDTAGGYVVEVNVANPGGLATLAQLYGEEAVTARMLAAIEMLAKHPTIGA